MSPCSLPPIQILLLCAHSGLSPLALGIEKFPSTMKRTVAGISTLSFTVQASASVLGDGEE